MTSQLSQNPDQLARDRTDAPLRQVGGAAPTDSRLQTISLVATDEARP